MNSLDIQIYLSVHQTSFKTKFTTSEANILSQGYCSNGRVFD